MKFLLEFLCQSVFFYSIFFEDDEEGGFPYEVNIMEKLGRFGTLEIISFALYIL